jgi:anti-sigma factor RsiW
MNITRDVVTDLWPLYESGEASADTRRLVEEFLKGDPELARRLREDESAKLLAAVPAPPSPDQETRALSAARKHLVKKDWPLFFAMVFSGLAFGRIVSDTSFDVSPRRFIATASVAALFWIWFLVRLARKYAVRA